MTDETKNDSGERVLHADDDDEANEPDELALREEWLERARKQTLETLPQFLEELANFPHSYGTAPRAVGAAAAAAAWALNATPRGGLTGFQAGYVLWDFLAGWDRHLAARPLKLLSYDNMLYPQRAVHFRTITRHVWYWLQQEARTNLTKYPDANPGVVAHWKSIVAGEVPFGYQIAED